MKIHNFIIPVLLESHLQSGGYGLSQGQLTRLRAMLTGIDSPRPRLWSFDQIVSQHELWNSSAATAYLGNESTDFSPGRIDPQRVLIIGEADEDSPIALDYRSHEPRVVYLGAVGPQAYWIELAPSYEQFLNAL